MDPDGEDLNIILPYSIAKMHKDILRRYIETNEEHIVNKIIKGFPTHANGYIVPMFITVKLSPHLERGLNICSMMIRDKSTKDYMLVRKDNLIEGVS